MGSEMCIRDRIMPMVPLDDAQLDQVIAYIEALGDGASTKD